MPRHARVLASLFAFALAAAPAHAQDCAVESASADVDSILVSPRDAPPFFVEVRDAVVEARPTAVPERVEVRVRGGVAFEGRVRELPLRPTRPLSLAGGVLALSPEARLTHARCVRGVLRVRAQPYLGVTIESVRVPADALTIDDPVRLPLPSPSWEAPAIFLPRARRLHVRAAPHRGAAIVVAVELAHLLPLERLARARGASRVRVRWSDGSAIEGWVDDEAIAPIEGGASATPMFPDGHGCGTTGGCGGEALYCGRARLAAETVITAAPSRGAWARAERELDVEVRWVRSEEWAAITRLPGVGDEHGCGLTRHAFVPASALTLP